MKKIFKIALVYFSLIITVYAAVPSNSAMLSAIENDFFGVDYPSNSETVRVERIEKVLYGTTQKGSVADRIKKISSDTGSVFKQQTQTADNKPVMPELKNNVVPKQTEYIAEDSSVEYPMVDKLEMQVFNTKHTGENIYSRLDRLEKAVFNSTSKDVLNARVEKLADKLLNQSPSIAENTSNNNSYYPSYTDKNSYNNYSTNGVYSDDYLFAQLGAMEKIAFDNIYPRDSISQRLNRLETKFFNKTFPQDNPKIRVERIATVNIAKNGSQMYDNNKAMRNFATASQIGGIILMILAMIL